MITSEILLLTNNIVIPFQDFKLDFVQLNKLFATRSLAEHGLGYMINVYDKADSQDQWGRILLKSFIFDMGSVNHTFLHNMTIRGYDPSSFDEILISHWHYDHVGSLYPLLEQIDKEVSIICHESSQYERFFKRSKEVKDGDLEGKKREEILPLLSASKIVNQEPIDLEKIESDNGRVIFSKDERVIFNSGGLKITLSGEIPRNHPEEEFSNFFFLRGDTLEQDDISDDKCLIFEYPENVVVLLGCCHSGLMNTLDHVRNITKKRVSHVIGGFHMASANEKRINRTLNYLESFQEDHEILYLFPIHCTGEHFFTILKNMKNTNLKAFNTSVGTVFTF